MRLNCPFVAKDSGSFRCLRPPTGAIECYRYCRGCSQWQTTEDIGPSGQYGWENKFVIMNYLICSIPPCYKFMKKNRRTFNAIMVDAENFLYIHHFRPNPTIAHFHPHHSSFDASSASLTASTGILPKVFGPIRESDGKCRLR